MTTLPNYKLLLRLCPHLPNAGLLATGIPYEFPHLGYAYLSINISIPFDFPLPCFSLSIYSFIYQLRFPSGLIKPIYLFFYLSPPYSPALVLPVACLSWVTMGYGLTTTTVRTLGCLKLKKRFKYYKF